MRPFPSPADLLHGADGPLLAGQDIEVGLGNVGADAESIHVEQNVEAAGTGRIGLAS